MLKSLNLLYCISIWVTPSLPLSADVIFEWPLVSIAAAAATQTLKAAEEGSTVANPSLPPSKAFELTVSVVVSFRLKSKSKNEREARSPATFLISRHF